MVDDTCVLGSEQLFLNNKQSYIMLGRQRINRFNCEPRGK